MSYISADGSVESGSPVELYWFTQGVETWLFTNNETAITVSSLVYVPSEISRSSIKQTENVFKENITLTFHRSSLFASQFVGYAPESVTTLTIFRGHLGDNNYITYWKGRVVGASASGNTISIECESVYSSLKVVGLRAHYEYNCRHPLYSAKCGASAELNKATTVVASFPSSTQVQTSLTGYANDWFKGGIAQAPDGARRMITAHTGNVLTLTRPFSTLGAGDTLTLYAGCDHQLTTCTTKFNNVVNFGGFPWVPTRNPLDGNSIV